MAQKIDSILKNNDFLTLCDNHKNLNKKIEANPEDEELKKLLDETILLECFSRKHLKLFAFVIFFVDIAFIYLL